MCIFRPNIKITKPIELEFDIKVANVWVMFQEVLFTFQIFLRARPTGL